MKTREDVKKEIVHPIMAAVILSLVFYAIEIPMVLLKCDRLCNIPDRVDSHLRIL
jgi:hypothetical protein